MAMRERSALAAPKSRTTAGKVRALPAARWALRRIERKVLAAWWGVSPTRVSHRTREGDNPLTEVCALIEHAKADGSAIVAAVLEAYERRFLDEPRAKLEARLAHLMSQEHTLESHQNRALQSGKAVNDALRSHVAALLEIVALRTVLGLEDA